VEMAIDKIRKLSTLKQCSVSSVNSLAVVAEKKTDTNSTSSTVVGEKKSDSSSNTSTVVGVKKTDSSGSAIIVIDDDDDDNEGSCDTLSLPENTRPVEMEPSAGRKSDQVKAVASSIVSVSCAPEIDNQSRSARITDTVMNSVAAVGSTVEGVLHTPVVPVAAVPVNQTVVNEKQLPGVLNTVSETSNEPSFNFNVAGFDFSKYHDMVSDLSVWFCLMSRKLQLTVYWNYWSVYVECAC